MNSLFEDAHDTEKVVANILLELPSLIIVYNEVPVWGFKGRRSARRITAPPHQLSPTALADDGGDSQFETCSCSESDDEKLVTDNQRIELINEENPSEIKDEASGLEPIGIAPERNMKRIKFKPPRPENSPRIGNADDSLSPKEDVIVVESKKKTFDKRESRRIKAEQSTALEANSFVPHKEPAEGKSLQEMENEVVFWEQHKRQILESIEKVKLYLETQKALNLQLKARKLQLSSVEAKSDSGR